MFKEVLGEIKVFRRSLRGESLIFFRFESKTWSLEGSEGRNCFWGEIWDFWSV